MTNEYIPEIKGEVRITLQHYEQIKQHMKTLQKERTEEHNRAKDVIEAARHISDFLTHLSKRIDNFQELVDAFNEASTHCEIHKTEDERYRVKVL